MTDMERNKHHPFHFSMCIQIGNNLKVVVPKQFWHQRLVSWKTVFSRMMGGWFWDGSNFFLAALFFLFFFVCACAPLPHQFCCREGKVLCRGRGRRMHSVHLWVCALEGTLLITEGAMQGTGGGASHPY